MRGLIHRTIGVVALLAMAGLPVAALACAFTCAPAAPAAEAHAHTSATTSACHATATTSPGPAAVSLDAPAMHDCASHEGVLIDRVIVAASRADTLVPPAAYQAVLPAAFNTAERLARDALTARHALVSRPPAVPRPSSVLRI